MKPSEQSPFPTLGLSQSRSMNLDKWQPQAELACPIPRRVALRWGYIAWSLFPAVFIFLFCSWILVSGLEMVFWGYFVAGSCSLAFLFLCELERREDRLLVSRGAATRGTVVESHERIILIGTDELVREDRDWKCVIAYDAPARRHITVFRERKRWVGDTLTVLYLPEAPEKAKLYEDCCHKAVAPRKGSDVSVMPHSPQR